MRQPRVPEYRESEGVGRYLKSLVLFLKDFCNEVWTATRNADKAISKAQAGVDGISYPVTSVNEKTGDVMLSAADLGAAMVTIGEEIPKGADLDAYVTPGDYYSKSAAVSETLVNAPVTTSGFKLTIYHLSYTTSLMQEIRSNRAAASVHRRVGKTDGTWNAWQTVIQSVDGIVPIDSGGTGATTASAARTNLGVNTKAETLLAAFPVGSIYTTNSTTSPAGYIGGTWERIDKSFPTGSSTASFFTAASGVTVSSSYFSRSGHSISWRLTLSCSSALTDTTVTLGTFNFETLGVTGFNCDQYVIGNSDGGNGFAMAVIDSETGEMTHRDRVVVGGGNLAADQSIVFTGVIVSNQGRMLNAVCNQFIYQRTA